MIRMTACLLAMLAASFSVGAQGVFRCGSSIVDTGLTVAELLGKCGEPDAKEVTVEPIRARNPGGGSREVGTTTIERWTYNRGRGQFPVLLTIEGGSVKRIEFLQR